MPYRTPDQIALAAVRSGVAKATQRPGPTLVAAFLAGAYIAFGSLVAIAVSSGLKPEIWGTLPTLFTGLVFALGLILVIIAGSELLTGNMALLPIALFSRQLRLGRVVINLGLVLVGNLLGSVFVAYFLAIKAGVIGSHGAAEGTPAALTFARLSAIARLKSVTETDLQIFLRAVGCNWLVCLAVWLALAAEDVAGKILAIVFPILAFVAIGFDHVVANMFFLPAAMFAHVPGVTFAHLANNLVIAFLGNLIGAAVFVAGAYYYLYLRTVPPDAFTGAEPGTGPGGESRSAGRASAV